MISLNWLHQLNVIKKLIYAFQYFFIVFAEVDSPALIFEFVIFVVLLFHFPNKKISAKIIIFYCVGLNKFWDIVKVSNFPFPIAILFQTLGKNSNKAHKIKFLINFYPNIFLRWRFANKIGKSTKNSQK